MMSNTHIPHTACMAIVRSLSQVRIAFRVRVRGGLRTGRLEVERWERRSEGISEGGEGEDRALEYD